MHQLVTPKQQQPVSYRPHQSRRAPRCSPLPLAAAAPPRLALRFCHPLLLPVRGGVSHAGERARTMHAQRMHSPWRYRARAKGARASFVRLQVCSYGRAVEDWGAGAASHLGLQLSTFCDLDGEGSPCFLRARHPRAWGAARSSNLMSLKKAR